MVLDIVAPRLVSRGMAGLHWVRKVVVVLWVHVLPMSRELNRTSAAPLVPTPTFFASYLRRGHRLVVECGVVVLGCVGHVGPCLDRGCSVGGLELVLFWMNLQI